MSSLIDVVTLFPEMFAVTQFGVSRRAQELGLFDFRAWNPRDYTHDNYRRVDDRPFGGGPGMVMIPEPLEVAIASATSQTGSCRCTRMRCICRRKAGCPQA